MDFSGEDEGHVNAPVNPDLPEFLVIPPRLWVGKTVSLHNGSGVRIAEGLVRNLRSNAIVGSAGPLGLMGSHDPTGDPVIPSREPEIPSHTW